MAVKRKIIPDCDHVVRYVSYARQARDDNDNLIGNGLEWAALQQKPDEDFVSVNWLEFYEKTKEENLKAVKQDLSRAFNNRLASKALLAIGDVGAIKQACRDAGQPVRVTHEPKDPDNLSHAGIRRLPKDKDDLLQTLVAEVFLETLFVTSI